MPTPPPGPAAVLTELRFADLMGWREDDAAAAFSAFLLSAPGLVRQPPADGALAVRASDLRSIASIALDQAAGRPDGMTPDDARAFFEANFTPYAVIPHQGHPFLTGYFEPEVEGSRARTERFRYPLYARPPDLVDVDDANRPIGWDAGNRFARQTAAGLEPYHDRADIDAGVLDGRGLELAYLADPVDVFFIHVQGSASIRLPDGSRLRLAYAAKAGHPYTSIGKRLIERGLASPQTMTLQTLRAWLTANRADGIALMRENRSYVFFRDLASEDLDPHLGAIAAAGVQITPGRSLAVDHTQHTYGTPIWLDAALPFGPDGSLEQVRRLVIAQDTGSAIVGPARGDMFMGLGAEAGQIAGRIRHVPTVFVMFKPK
jgi:membrane-bound lytic murein transglycosylase A